MSLMSPLENRSAGKNRPVCAIAHLKDETNKHMERRVLCILRYFGGKITQKTCYSHRFLSHNHRKMLHVILGSGYSCNFVSLELTLHRTQPE